MKDIHFNPADFEHVRQIALQFPNASDSLSHYDTPSIKIGKNLLCRLHENGEWLAVRTDFESRERYLEQYPESCFITPHYKDYPYVCLYIHSYSPELLQDVLTSGYRAIIEKKKK